MCLRNPTATKDGTMPEQTPTLRDMIKNALDSGLTYRQLAAAAIDEETGKRASHAIFFDIANGKLDRMPYDYHLRAIAAGLRAPYESVRRAAIAQWVPGDTPVGDDERAAQVAELRSLRDQADEALRRMEEGPGRRAG